MSFARDAEPPVTRGLVSALCLVLAFCSAGDAAAAGTGDALAVSAEQQRALGIQTAPLGQSAGAVATGLPSRVVLPPSQIAVVAAPVGGLVTRVAKAHNDPVAADEPLFTLTSTQLVEEQVALFKAASQQRLAAEAAQRDARLLKDGIIPEVRYHATRAEAQRADAEVRALRQRLRLGGLGDREIERSEQDGAIADAVTVRSPIAGVLIELDASPGARVEAGMPLGKVADLSRLWLEVQVPAEQAVLVRPGLPIEVPGTPVEGTVTLVESEMSNAQTVAARVEVRASAHLLRPGQSVEVRIGALADARHWRVPSSAIVWQGGGTYLFVAVPDGFRAQPVSVVNQSATAAGITGELKGDEQVATRGVAALKSLWLGAGAAE
jgi:RND family efflux transporter MFP subunit